MEKQARNVVQDIGYSISDLANLMVKHPKTTLGIASALAGLSLVANMANKVRGLHQITSENSKAKRMDYQTQLLRQIAENQKAGPAPVMTPRSTDPKIIVPPLR